jgi:hypothetical protein
MRAFVVKLDLISAWFCLPCFSPGEVALRLACTRQQTRIRLALRPEP